MQFTSGGKNRGESWRAHLVLEDLPVGNGDIEQEGKAEGNSYK